VRERTRTLLNREDEVKNVESTFFTMILAKKRSCLLSAMSAERRDELRYNYKNYNAENTTEN
jgi:hypothetical protein